MEFRRIRMPSDSNSVQIRRKSDCRSQEKKSEWRAGFEAMGEDPNMDVSYAFAAQAEVVLRESDAEEI